MTPAALDRIAETLAALAADWRDHGHAPDPFVLGTLERALHEQAVMIAEGLVDD